MPKAPNEKRIAELMEILNCSREEALDVIQEDEAIDHGERVYFDLSPEQEKQAKKFANVDTHKRAKNAAPRERKPNEQKELIVSILATFLNGNCGFPCENVEITNKNRMIAFNSGEKRFELTLVEKRPPKK